MSNLTFSDLSDLAAELDRLDQPLVDSLTKIFSDNNVSIDSHVLFLPNEFKSLIRVPNKLRKSILFSPHSTELIFIRIEETKPPKFEFQTRYLLRHPLSPINYSGA